MDRAINELHVGRCARAVDAERLDHVVVLRGEPRAAFRERRVGSGGGFEPEHVEFERLQRAEHIAGRVAQRIHASCLPHGERARADREHDEQPDRSAQVADASEQGGGFLFESLQERGADHRRHSRHARGRTGGDQAVDDLPGVHLAGVAAECVAEDAEVQFGSVGSESDGGRVRGAGVRERNAVDPGAVRAVQVDDGPSIVARPEFQVFGADLIVIEDDVVGGRATDADGARETERAGGAGGGDFDFTLWCAAGGHLLIVASGAEIANGGPGEAARRRRGDSARDNLMTHRRCRLRDSGSCQENSSCPRATLCRPSPSRSSTGSSRSGAIA